jgi:histone H3/H4
MSDSNQINPAEFVVKSKVKTIVAEADMRISGDAWSDLGHQVTRTVKSAIRRAKANGRKTIKGSDF